MLFHSLETTQPLKSFSVVWKADLISLTLYFACVFKSAELGVQISQLFPFCTIFITSCFYRDSFYFRTQSRHLFFFFLLSSPPPTPGHLVFQTEPRYILIGPAVRSVLCSPIGTVAGFILQLEDLEARIFRGLKPKLLLKFKAVHKSSVSVYNKGIYSFSCQYYPCSTWVWFSALEGLLITATFCSRGT